MKKRYLIFLAPIPLLFFLDEILLLDIPGHLKALHAVQPVLFVVLYILTCWIVTIFALPGLAIMTLLAGLLLGRWSGYALALLANGTAAILSFLAARYLFRDWIEKRFAKHTEIMKRQIEKHGKSYLFSLRMIPGLPFALLNYVFGLSVMPLKDYWWVTILGLLPMTFLFVNAGSQMAMISTPAELFTPGIIVSLLLLAIVPFVIKFFVKRWSR